MNKIFTIFYGGTTLYDKKDGFVCVEKKDDIQKWLGKIPEISLIANTQDFLIIEKERETKTRENLIKIVNTIELNIKNYDGILILHDADSIPTLSNQLFWLIQNPTKPIVITGSNTMEQETGSVPDLSFKANLINSLQVINSRINKISTVYGNRVIAASKIHRCSLSDLNIFDSIDSKYLAKIDFGLSIEDENKIIPLETKYFYKMSDDYLFLETIPEINILESLLSKNNPIKVLIFKSWPNKIMDREKLVKLFKLSQENKKLVILYSKMSFGKSFFHTILTISNISPECLCAKLSWILGQTKNEEKIKDLLCKNIQGEFIE